MIEKIEMRCLHCRKDIGDIDILNNFECEGEKENKCSFELLKKQYPLLTEKKLKSLLSGKKNIFLKKENGFKCYYSIINGILAGTKKCKTIYMEDDLI